MNISEIMSKDATFVGPNDALAHVRNLFIKKGISRVIVYDDKPIGVVTESDISKAFFEERRGIDEVRVREVMSKGLITVPPDVAPESVAALMIKRNISGIPVVADKKVLGMITKDDLVRYFGDYFRGQAKIIDLMRDAPTIKEFQSIFQASKLMKKAKCQKLVVIRDRKAAGILTDRDISLASFGLRPSKIVLMRKTDLGITQRNVRIRPIIVGDIMREDVVKINPAEDAAKGARIMVDKGIGSLVVEEGDKLRGLVTKTEYVNYLAQRVTQND
jgi:CBS domain-containing protein